MGCQNISWVTLDEYIRRKSILILDIRSESDFKEKHIKYAVNIEYDEMEKIINNLIKQNQMNVKHIGFRNRNSIKNMKFENNKIDDISKIQNNDMKVKNIKLIIKGKEIEKNKIIVIYCDRGAHSFYICSKLAELGYNVKSLAGGINGYKGRYLIT